VYCNSFFSNSLGGATKNLSGSESSARSMLFPLPSNQGYPKALVWKAGHRPNSVPAFPIKSRASVVLPGCARPPRWGPGFFYFLMYQGLTTFLEGAWHFLGPLVFPANALFSSAKSPVIHSLHFLCIDQITLSDRFPRLGSNAIPVGPPFVEVESPIRFLTCLHGRSCSVAPRMPPDRQDLSSCL
jgi:hypothetical protein